MSVSAGYLRLVREKTPGNENNTPILDSTPWFPTALEGQPSITTELIRRDDEIGRGDEPAPAFVESLKVSWEIKFRGYSDHLARALTILFGSPVTVAGNGTLVDQEGDIVPIGKNIHKWTAPFIQGTIPPTVRGVFAYKNESVWIELLGMAATKLSIDTPDSGGVMFTLSGVGTVGRNLSSDPAYVPVVQSLGIRPFTASGLKIGTWNSPEAKHTGLSLAVDVPVETYSSLGTRSKFDSDVEYGAGLAKVSGQVPNRHITNADLTAYYTAAGFPVVVGWKADGQAGDSYGEKATYKGNYAQYVGGGPEAVTNGRHTGSSFDFEVSRNDAASSIFEIVNSTASYAFVDAP